MLNRMDGREPVSGYICLLYCTRYEFSTSRLSITFQQHRRNLADSGHRPEKAVTHNRIIIPRITRTSQFKTDTPFLSQGKRPDPIAFDFFLYRILFYSDRLKRRRDEQAKEVACSTKYFRLHSKRDEKCRPRSHDSAPQIA